MKENNMSNVGTQSPMAFCVKCKAQRLIHQAREEVSGSRRALKGVCSVCGTKVNKFLGKA